MSHQVPLPVKVTHCSWNFCLLLSGITFLFAKSRNLKSKVETYFWFLLKIYIRSTISSTAFTETTGPSMVTVLSLNSIFSSSNLLFMWPERLYSTQQQFISRKLKTEENVNKLWTWERHQKPTTIRKGGNSGLLELNSKWMRQGG